MVNTPAFFTSPAATATRLFNTLEQAFVFTPCSVAMALSNAPFVMAFAPVFIDFMGGNMVLLSSARGDGDQRSE